MIGAVRIGAGALAGQWVRNPPSVAITAPGQSVATAAVTISWTYASSVPRPQAQFRVRLTSPDTTVEYYDSGIVTGPATSFVPAFTLSDGSTYLVSVQVSDGYDWSAPATAQFSVALADVGDFPNADVGSVYEVGINGVGLMLADRKQQDLEYRRQTAGLQAPRFAEGSTPFSEAIERYSFVGWADWRDGAGQQSRNRQDSSPAAYLEGEGVNPFEKTGLQLLPATAQTLATAYANPLSVVASNKLYTLTGAKQLTEVAAIGGAVNTVTIAGQTTVLAVASDGTNWYVADGVNIHRGTGTTDPGAAWATVDAKVMAWAADRLCVGYVGASSTTPNVFSTLTDAGAEEVASGRLILPPGSTITSITGGDGYVWFSARRNQQGLVYAWKAGSTDAPFVAFEFPAGQFPQSLGFYLGNVFVRCIEPLAAGGAKATIYQSATSSGRLIPQVVTTIESTTDDHTVGAFGGDDRFAMFSWKKQTIGGRSGVGAIDLSTGGHARWLYAPADTATGDVVSVVNWNGRTVFAVAGYGVCHETTGPVPSGFLRTDIADLGSSVAKVLSQLKADTAPLPTGAGLSISFTVDGGASYSPNVFSMSGAGLQTLTGDISKQAVTVGLKITLTATTVTPVLRSVTLRVHPIGLADQVIVLPVNCSDDPIGLNGQPLPEGGKGSGAARARFLESLAQTRIRYQDIDWAATGVSSIWEVEQVEVRSISVFDRQLNRQSHDQVAVLSLRRSFK
jgi:hypothetical protein